MGGRFNSKGRSVVYTSETLSLAALEVLVHADPAVLRGRYWAHSLEIPASLVGTWTERSAASLPRDWKKYPGPPSLRRLGDRWFDRGATAILVVPSVVVPEERNFIVNPGHPDFAKLKRGPSRQYVFDRRLIKVP